MPYFSLVTQIINWVLLIHFLQYFQHNIPKAQSMRQVDPGQLYVEMLTDDLPFPNEKTLDLGYNTCNKRMNNSLLHK